MIKDIQQKIKHIRSEASRYRAKAALSAELGPSWLEVAEALELAAAILQREYPSEVESEDR